MKLTAEAKPEQAPKFRRFLRILWKQRFLQLMVWPGIIWMIIFNYIPMAGIQIAFRDFRITRGIWAGDFIGFRHFIDFFTDDRFYQILTNTVGISLVNLIFGFPLPIIFALLLNELAGSRFKRIVQTLSYLPHFLSWVIFGGLILTWLSTHGLLNNVLVSIGLLSDADRSAWLGNPNTIWLWVWFTNSWKTLGFSAIIYLAAISSVEQEMYEAATIDGATRFQKVRYITLPSITGTISILLILTIANLLSTNFDQLMIMGNVLNRSRSLVLDVHVYEIGLTLGRFSYATAVGLARSVTAALLLVAANFAAKKILGRGLY